jgi:Ca2+/Na+ antiporter
MGIIIPILIVTLCCIVIWRASDGFTLASEYIGRNLSEGVRGATINAIGSSLPEVFTSFFFLFYLKDVDGFSGGIGTTAGSAIFNSMIIPSFAILVVIYTGVASQIKISRKVLRRDGIALILAEVIFIMLISGQILDWWHGFILIVIYFIYLFYMLGTMKRVEVEDRHVPNVSDVVEHREQKKDFWKALFTLDLEYLFIREGDMTNKKAWPLLIFSTFTIAFICFLLVQACEWLGKDEYSIFGYGKFNGLNIPIMFVAVILASAASSVPDTILSMNDARRGNYDDAISNALGSNIFDICFALGFPLFIYTIVYGPIEMHQEVIDLSAELRMLLLIFTVLAFIVYISRKIINQTQAFMLLGIYLLFTLYVLGRGSGNEIVIKFSAVLREMVSYISLF